MYKLSSSGLESIAQRDRCAARHAAKGHGAIVVVNNMIMSGPIILVDMTILLDLNGEYPLNRWTKRGNREV